MARAPQARTPKPPPNLGTLIQDLAGPDLGKARAAARALAIPGVKDAVPALVDALDRREVRSDAACALIAIGDESALGKLIAIADAEEPVVRDGVNWASPVIHAFLNCGHRELQQKAEAWAEMHRLATASLEKAYLSTPYSVAVDPHAIEERASIRYECGREVAEITVEFPPQGQLGFPGPLSDKRYPIADDRDITGMTHREVVDEAHVIIRWPSESRRLFWGGEAP